MCEIVIVVSAVKVHLIHILLLTVFAVAVAVLFYSGYFAIAFAWSCLALPCRLFGVFTFAIHQQLVCMSVWRENLKRHQ